MPAPPALSVSLEETVPALAVQQPSPPLLGPALKNTPTQPTPVPAASQETAQPPSPAKTIMATQAPTLSPQPALRIEAPSGPVVLAASSPATTPNVLQEAVTKTNTETKPQTPPSSPAPAPVTALPSLPVAADLNWYSMRELDKPPRALSPIRPKYPALANSRGIEGNVKMRFRVDEFGRVEDAEVLEGSPPGVFDEAALEALEKARFSPAQRNQRPVRALIEMRIGFKLED